MRISRSSQEKGFSLIESLIALSILSIGVLGLIQLMGVSTHQSAFSRNSTMAVAIAEQQLEELRGLYNYDLVQTAAGTETVSTGLAESTFTGSPVTLSAPAGSAMGNVTFDVSWTVVYDPPGSAHPREKTVTVTVTPQIANPQQNETATIATTFAP